MAKSIIPLALMPIPFALYPILVRNLEPIPQVFFSNSLEETSTPWWEQREHGESLSLHTLVIVLEFVVEYGLLCMVDSSFSYTCSSWWNFSNILSFIWNSSCNFLTIPKRNYPWDNNLSWISCLWSLKNCNCLLNLELSSWIYWFMSSSSWSLSLFTDLTMVVLLQPRNLQFQTRKGISGRI